MMSVRVIYKSGQSQDFIASGSMALSDFIQMAIILGGPIRGMEYP